MSYCMMAENVITFSYIKGRTCVGSPRAYLFKEHVTCCVENTEKGGDYVFSHFRNGEKEYLSAV